MDSQRNNHSQGAPDPHGRKASDRRSVKLERRVNARLPCLGTSGITFLPSGRKALGCPVNLSLGGCCIESDAAIPAVIGNCVDAYLRVEGSTMLVAGVIRHLNKNTRAGIEFIGLSGSKAEQIHRLTSEISASNKQL